MTSGLLRTCVCIDRGGEWGRLPEPHSFTACSHRWARATDTSTGGVGVGWGRAHQSQPLVRGDGAVGGKVQFRKRLVDNQVKRLTAAERGSSSMRGA